MRGSRKSRRSHPEFVGVTKRWIVTTGLSLGLIALVWSPAAAASSYVYYGPSGCMAFYNDGTYLGSAQGNLSLSSSQSTGWNYTYGGLTSGGCGSTVNGYTVEAGHYHWWWIQGGYQYCTVGYSGQQSGGYAYAYTSCAFTILAKTYNNSRFWVSGNPKDMTTEKLEVS